MKTIQIKNLTIGEGRPKIAVPVMAETEEAILLRIRQIAASKADLIELRGDAYQELEDPEAIQGLLRRAEEEAGELPLLFTVRTKAEGGLYGGTDYKEVVETAIKSHRISLVDVELERESSAELLLLAKEAGIPVIASFHDFHGTPDTASLRERLSAMEQAGADIAKIACMPETEADADRLLAAGAWAIRHLSIPSLVIAMGERGQVSRVAGESFGSVLSFGCLPGEESAPGQMETDELLQALEELHERRAEGRFLFLIGFMGSGKSTVARAFARKQGRPIIEMDAEIERAAGCTISEIFEKDGEEAFRDRETHFLTGLYKEQRAVVSVGGGCALRPENKALMQALGTVVYLTAEPSTILKRLQGKSESRPNIRNRMSIEGIQELMDRRQADYVEAADLQIATDGKNPEAILSEIGLACPIDLL